MTMQFRRWGWLVVLAGTLVNGAFADEPKADQAKPEKKSPPVTLDEGDADFSNWVGLSLGGASVSGNDAAFQQRVGLPANSVFGGVSDLHLEHAFTNKWTLKLDGHGLFDYHDYGIKLDLTREDRGFFRAGYNEFRTYYNGSGGYLPGADLWYSLPDSELFLDRGSAFVEGGLTLPGWPALRIKYTHDFRDGQKDSTIWGQVNTPYGARGIGASFYNLDEKRDTIEGEITHTIGKTDLGLKLTYEMADQDNSWNTQQFPGTPNSYVTQKEAVESDLFNVHGWSSTWFNQQTVLSLGYGYTHLDTDLTGSRVYGDQFDPVYDPAVLRGPGYINLSGGSELDQQVANVSFMFLPAKHWVIVPALKIQYQDVDGVSLYQPINPGVVSGTNLGGVIIPDPNATGLASTDTSRRQTTVAPRLEVRYTGITNWLFYARGEWEVDDGDLSENSRPIDANVLSAPADADLRRTTDYQGLLQKYVVGANWYPVRKLSLAAQYYYQQRSQDYDNTLDSTPNDSTSFNRYPAYLRANDSYTHDANIRLTWRALPTLTSVTRYDYQISTVETRADLLSTIESADLNTHILSQSLTWSPLDRFYLQGSISYVLDELTTPVSDSSATPGLVQDAENDYWYATLGAGLALGKNTDLLADYSYYRADNYDPGNYQVSVPYGASAREHAVSVGLVQRINRNLRCSVRYAYFHSEDETSGGNNDFDAHVISAGVQYRF
jgi:predicted porin